MTDEEALYRDATALIEACINGVETSKTHLGYDYNRLITLARIVMANWKYISPQKSPPLCGASHNTGERDPSEMPDSGGGDATLSSHHQQGE